MKKFLKEKRNLLLLCWPLAFLILILVRLNSDIAEYVFARGIYRGYRVVMYVLFGFLPFSVGEWLLIAFAVCLMLYPIITIVKIIKSREKLYTLLSFIRYLLIAVGIIFLWFMIGGGANYYRYEFAQFSGLEIKKSSVDELCDLYRELIEKTNAARKELGIRDDEPFVSSLSNRERAKEANAAMEKLAEKYDVIEKFYSYAKPVIFSRALSEFNITGVYFMWTLESNVNTDVTDYTKGATMCHELSHQCGFMREDEANFIAYLACTGSDSLELRYSGYMLALVHTGNKLYETDKTLYSELRKLYDPGVNLDFAENSRYWNQFRDTALSTAGEKMNNTYLKMNNVDDGTKSYGRMVDLLLAERRKKLSSD